MEINEKAAEIVRKTPAFSWEWPKIGWFLPMGRNVPSACVPSLLAMQARNIMPMLNMGRNCLLDKTRTMAATKLLDSDLDAVLMTDDDHIHDIDLPGKLAAWMVAFRDTDSPVHVIGGLNFARFGDHKPCAFIDMPGKPRWDGHARPESIAMPTKWEEGKIFPVAALGTGSILIAREAFEAIEYPYFRAPTEWVTGTEHEHAWPGEDIGFAANCRRNGVQQYCDPGCVSPHLGETYVDQTFYHPDEIPESELETPGGEP